MTWMRVERTDSPFTRECGTGQVLAIPVSHGEGRYVADPETLERLEGERRVLLRYVAADGSPVGGVSVNGSMRDIAGIVSAQGNVLGMMPHPERACEPLLGSDDGLRMFRSVVAAVEHDSLFADAAPRREPVR
jgi:phosphoribosylformylglycinamidine synthase